MYPVVTVMYYSDSQWYGFCTLWLLSCTIVTIGDTAHVSLVTVMYYSDSQWWLLYTAVTVMHYRDSQWHGSCTLWLLSCTIVTIGDKAHVSLVTVMYYSDSQWRLLYTVVTVMHCSDSQWHGSCTLRLLSCIIVTVSGMAPVHCGYCHVL